MPQVVGIDHIAITVSNLSNLAIDSKLRGCDVVSLRVKDVAPHGRAILARAGAGPWKPIRSNETWPRSSWIA